MTPSTLLGLAIGLPLGVVVLVLVILAATGVFSSGGGAAVTPTVTSVPDTVREERTSNVRVLGVSSVTTVDFDAAFGAVPAGDVVAIRDVALLGEPEATAVLAPVSNAQATLTLTVGSFPSTQPGDKVVANTSASPAAMGVLFDSLDHVWVSVRDPLDLSRSQYARNASGLGATDFSALQPGTENAAEDVYSTFWHETQDGNVVQYSCYATGGGATFAGLYGPAAGETLLTPCSGFNNARAQGMQAVAMPGNPDRVFLPFHVVPSATWVHESLNGGKDFQPAVAINAAVGTFYPTMAFFNDLQALVAFTTDAFEVAVTYFDGVTWTDRGTIPGVSNVASSAQTVVLDGTVAVFYAQESPARNAFVVFSTDNNLGVTWTAPMDLGLVADGTVRDIRAGTSNGVPWVVSHNNSNVLQGRVCPQSNGQGLWSDLHALGESTPALNCFGADFSPAGLLTSSATSVPTLVYNVVPTQARVEWFVQGPGIEPGPDPGV